MDCKVKNATEIRQLATDVVRMANANHPMLEQTYEKLIDTGVKHPYFTQITLKNAEYDSYIKAAKEFTDSELSRHEYLDRFKNTRGNLSSLDKSETGKRLYDSMKALGIKNIQISPEDKEAYNKALKKAKKNMQKRIAILSGLTEGTKQLVPCSTNKTIKKLTYFFLRLANH